MAAEPDAGETSHPARIIEWAYRVRAALKQTAAIRVLLAALVAVMAGLLYQPSTVLLVLEMRSTTGAPGEVFHAGPGEGYAQERSTRFLITDDGQWHTYTVEIPAEKPLARVRIDPGTGPGQVSVRSVTLGRGPSRHFHGATLNAALGTTKHLQQQESAPGQLDFVSLGTDPHFDIRLEPSIGGHSHLTRTADLSLIAALAMLAWMLLEWAARGIRQHLAKLPTHDRFTGKIISLTSDEQVLVVTRPIIATFVCIAVLATVFVGCRLHQSSIGVWDTVYPHAEATQAGLGTAKRIRSDEWRVQTPWVLNQVLTGNHARNQNVGGELSPLVTAVPVEGVLGWPQAKFAGFQLFDIETGFSWWWAYKTFALLLSFLWLFLILSRGDLVASLIGTAWIYTSSFTQWWFSINLPEILIAFALGVTGAIYAMFSGRRRLIVLGCVLLFYAAANLALSLYPPFIIPLAYLGLALLLGYAVRGGVRIRSLPGFRITALALTVGAISAYGLAFIGQASGTIDVMLDTVYPGRRVSDSGGVPMMKLFSGYFESLRVGEQRFPFPPNNASEASSFVLLAPLVLLVIPLRELVRRNGAMLLTLTGFCVVAFAWIAIDLPAAMDRVMQTLGWSMVTPKRAVLALGVASITVCVLLFARARDGRETVQPRGLRYAAIAVGTITVGLIGWWLQGIDPAFFTGKVLLIGTLASALAITGLALGRAHLLIAGLAIHALATLGVNPLVSGTSALTGKPVFVAARQTGSGPDDRWAVIGDNTLAQGLKAQGLSVFAGTQFLPDRAAIAVLDPEHRRKRVWNRYSTIGLLSDPAAKSASFKLRRGDQYSITLDVCGGQLAQIGVTHLAYTTAVPAADRQCLQPLPAPGDSGVLLFRLVR